MGKIYKYRNARKKHVRITNTSRLMQVFKKYLPREKIKTEHPLKTCLNCYIQFKVRKSVHHRTIQINLQPDATIFQFIILKSIYSSTCFRRFPTHHQELNDCSGSLWFYFRIVVIIVLCSWSSTTITTIRK